MTRTTRRRARTKTRRTRPRLGALTSSLLLSRGTLRFPPVARGEIIDFVNKGANDSEA